MEAYLVAQGVGEGCGLDDPVLGAVHLGTHTNETRQELVLGMNDPAILKGRGSTWIMMPSLLSVCSMKPCDAVGVRYMLAM